ncbi:MAG: hypothetical protein Kow00133_03140 [Amphiplicatus sp.]
MLHKMLLALIATTLAGQARADEIAVALTDSLIEVDAGFAGARIVLFGAVSGVDPSAEGGSAYDIVAVLRGPDAAFRIRPMERRGLIWTKGPAVRVEQAPSLYVAAATRPVEEFARPDLQRALGLRADRLDIAARLRATNEKAAAALAAHGAPAMVEAFLDASRQAGRFREIAGAVSFHKGPLFSIAIDLPPTTPIGEYAADVYLIREGEVLAQDAERLSVSKVGLERRIYDLAHRRPFSYGIVCVAVSLLAGWLGAAAFRK